MVTGWSRAFPIRLPAVAAALLLGGTTATAAETPTAFEDILWITEEYAPYNFTDDDGDLTGITVDVLTELWRRLDADIDTDAIRVLPWARGYRMAQENPAACVGATTITDSRREQFRFVGPYVDARNAVVGPASTADGDYEDIGDLAGMEIGVVRDDVAEQLMQDAGAPVRYVRVAEPDTMLRMLDGDRFDAVAYNVLVVNWTMRDLGIDPDGYDELLLLDEGGMGLACHPEMSPELIEQMEAALEAMRDDGTLEEIRTRYLDAAGGMPLSRKRERHRAVPPPPRGGEIARVNQ